MVADISPLPGADSPPLPAAEISPSRLTYPTVFRYRAVSRMLGVASSLAGAQGAVTAADSSFLFVDLVGFTALAAEHGDNHAADAAHTLYSCVRPLLNGHRAQEIKTIGDAMMLRCEGPDHAVRLGLGIVRCVEEQGSLPAIRVGIHTGPAVHRHGDWYGSTVNVAARLCSAAGSGEVLASDATWRAAGRLPGLRAGDERLHWLKNVTQPVPARVILEDVPPAGPRWRWWGRLRLIVGGLSARRRWDRTGERLHRLGERQAHMCRLERAAPLLSCPTTFSPRDDGGAA